MVRFNEGRARAQSLAASVEDAKTARWRVPLEHGVPTIKASRSQQKSRMSLAPVLTQTTSEILQEKMIQRRARRRVGLGYVGFHCRRVRQRGLLGHGNRSERCQAKQSER